MLKGGLQKHSKRAFLKRVLTKRFKRRFKIILNCVLKRIF